MPRGVLSRPKQRRTESRVCNSCGSPWNVTDVPPLDQAIPCPDCHGGVLVATQPHDGPKIVVTECGWWAFLNEIRVAKFSPDYNAQLYRMLWLMPWYKAVQSAAENVRRRQWAETYRAALED